MKPKRGSYKESKSIQRKKLTEFEKKWGEVCNICHRRKGTFMTTKGAEGGRDSICECD